MLLKPCRVCGVPSKRGVCEVHKRSRQDSRPPRNQRGYDAEYDKARRALRDAVAQALEEGRPVACCICGGPILRLADFSAEHVRPVRHGGQTRGNLGPAHKACNYGWRKRGRR